MGHPHACVQTRGGCQNHLINSLLIFILYRYRQNEVVSFLEEHMNVEVDLSKLQPQPGLCPRVIRMNIVVKHDVAV